MISTAQYANLIQRIEELEADNRFLAHIGALRKEMSELNQDFYLEVAKGNIPGHSVIHKYGRNSDIDIASGFEAIWNGGGDYTGHDCIVAETLETASASTSDVGTILSSGTLTSGSTTTLIDSGATFVSDGVAVGDIAINDTLQDHGIVSAVSETQITVLAMDDEKVNANGNTYRIVTKGSTGAPVVKLMQLLDSDFDNETSEYIVLNGTTAVDTTGQYIRHSRARVFGGDSIGEITTNQKTTTANVTMVLPVGYNSTMIAAYTIPAGKRAYFLSWMASKAKKQASFSNVRLMIKPVNCSYQVAEEIATSSTGTTAFNRPFKAPKNSLAPMTDIKVMADTDLNDSGVAATFDLILVDV